MEQDHWQRIQDLFWRLRSLDGAERERALLAECHDDDTLRADLRSLLDADCSSGILDVGEPILAPLHEVLRETAPQQVGPYIIAAEIGRGGMGVVYRAHDPRLQRDVALKFLPPGLHLHATARARFIAEARAASALDHPNICTIYDIGAAEDDRLFIAMAYYPRGTLAQRLAASPLPVSAATKIAIQIGDALECAHEAGIVHRDVKPANIAFGERGEVKVLDFGVAVLSDDAESAGIAGTPAYMAPEQLRGQAVDRRADVWALGVVLYEMLSGSKPFAGSDHHTVRQAIARDALPDLKAVRPDLPDNIVRIVNGALQRDPAERTPTAKAVADALRAAMAPPLVVQKRHPALRYAVMIGLFLAVGGVLQLRGPRLADGETAAIAVLPFTNITGQPQDEHFADGVTEDILTQLSRIPGLMVRSRTSVMRYKGTEHDVREIGELLEVPYVLEGSVRRAGDGVRIVAQLIDARTDRHVWAETYDRRLTDLFLVQSEIARDIARALGAARDGHAAGCDARAGCQRVRAVPARARALSHAYARSARGSDRAVPQRAHARSRLRPRPRVPRQFLCPLDWSGLRACRSALLAGLGRTSRAARHHAGTAAARRVRRAGRSLQHCGKARRCHSAARARARGRSQLRAGDVRAVAHLPHRLPLR